MCGYNARYNMHSVGRLNTSRTGRKIKIKTDERVACGVGRYIVIDLREKFSMPVTGVQGSRGGGGIVGKKYASVGLSADIKRVGT